MEFVKIRDLSSQIIIGKENMINAWKKEKHNLKFTLGDIKDRMIRINKNSCSVLLSYYVKTNYPDGTNHIHKQNIDLTWVKKKR